MTDDHLGIFDRGDGATAGDDPRRRVRRGRGASDDDNDVDLEAVRAALSSGAAARKHDDAPPRPTRMAARAEQQKQRAAAKRRNRRRRRSAIIALLVLALISGGIVVGFVLWNDPGDQVIRDYAGSGDSEVIVRVRPGDGLDTIAQTLADADVVASAQAFSDSAANDADVAALRPGYYRVRQHSSADAAADQIVDQGNRVGHVRLVPGGQLLDMTLPGNDPVPGYLTQIAEAACVPLNGRTDCAGVDELKRAARTATPRELGVVQWAIEPVRRAPDPDRRLEGLIQPGDYDVQPGADATTLLRQVLSTSTARWNSSDIIAEAATQDISPYRAVVVASVVEREGITTDMPQVARVIYNRLQKGMKLQMDSTVNYALGRAQIATSNADRQDRSPYNTYRHPGLPPTPISSPGDDALAATVDPAPGDWMYFVKVNKSGESCFSVTFAEHSKCVAKAKAAGVFDE